jgi:cyanophycin synthetase
LLFVKSLIAERVREGGTLILNADDEALARLAENPRVSKVPKNFVYYSLASHNPLVEQQAQRGTAYCLRHGWVVELAGGVERPVIAAAAMPFTLGGAADYQVSNAMAAIAATRACGLSAERIVESLLGYTDIAHNPGRGNLYRVGKGYVLVDYGHNPEAFNAVGQTLMGVTGGRLTGIVGVPGDRNDEVIKQAGRVVAQRFDRLIVREDLDLRGRKSGEVAKLVIRSAAEVMPGIECRVVLDERDALELAIREMQEEEIIVIFYEKKLGPIIEVLERHSATPIKNFNVAYHAV